MKEKIKKIKNYLSYHLNFDNDIFIIITICVGVGILIVTLVFSIAYLDFITSYGDYVFNCENEKYELIDYSCDIFNGGIKCRQHFFYENNENLFYLNDNSCAINFINK